MEITGFLNRLSRFKSGRGTTLQQNSFDPKSVDDVSLSRTVVRPRSRRFRHGEERQSTLWASVEPIERVCLSCTERMAKTFEVLLQSAT